jgi:hypothetical protein
MPLKAIKPTAAKQSRAKISIFGAPGVGKTWGAMGFPGVYYICTEPGNQLPAYMKRLEEHGGMYFGPDEGANAPKEVLNEIRELSLGGHDYKTLVIDSVSKLWGSILTAEQERLGDKDAFGASKKPPVAFMRSLISACDRLDMNTILIHHQAAKWSNGEQVGWGADGWDKTDYELNLALQITHTGPQRLAIPIKSREEGFVVGEGFPWCYEEFAERFGKGRLEANVSAYNYATAQQLGVLNSLIERLSITEDKQAGWLKKLGVESFQDASEEKVEKIIKHLQGH